MRAELPINPLGTIDRRPFDPYLTFLARIPDSVDLGAAGVAARGAGRKQATFDALMSTASASQGPVLDALRGLAELGKVTRIERLYSPNMVVATARDTASVDLLLDTFLAAGARSVYRATDGSAVEFADQVPNPHRGEERELRRAAPRRETGSGEDPTRPTGVPGPDAPGADDWDLAAIGVPQALAAGATGAGLVFGSIDTGVDGTHPALAGSYRGRSGDPMVRDDHNWFDFGAAPSPTPRDYRWHGSHTTGSVVGRGPKGAFGVAPDATWIAVAGMTPQSHDVLNLLRAVQWMQAPTRRDGTQPDPSAAPDVVGMSWWAAPNAGDLFRDSMRNLSAAGIVPVKSMGNQGPGPETGTSPGQFPEVITVTSTDEQDNVPEFASRGPSPWHESGSAPPNKPDIAAPGVGIRSSVPGGQYATWSGTSMAQPHVSGAILDTLSLYPELTDQQLREALASGARDLGAAGPDSESGAGVVDIPRMLDAAARILGVPPRQRRAGIPAA